MCLSYAVASCHGRECVCAMFMGTLHNGYDFSRVYTYQSTGRRAIASTWPWKTHEILWPQKRPVLISHVVWQYHCCSFISCMAVYSFLSFRRCLERSDKIEYSTSNLAIIIGKHCFAFKTFRGSLVPVDNLTRLILLFCDVLKQINRDLFLCFVLLNGTIQLPPHFCKCIGCDLGWHLCFCEVVVCWLSMTELPF